MTGGSTDMGNFDLQQVVLSQVKTRSDLDRVTEAYSRALARLADRYPDDMMAAYEAQKANREAVGKWIDAGYKGERQEMRALPETVQVLVDGYKEALKSAYMEASGSAYTILPYDGKPIEALDPTKVSRENIYMTHLVDGQFATTGSAVAEYVMRASVPGYGGLQVDGNDVFLPNNPIREFRPNGDGVLAVPAAVYEVPVAEMEPETCMDFKVEEGKVTDVAFVRFDGEWTRQSPEPLPTTACHVVTEMPALYFSMRNVSCMEKDERISLSDASREAASTKAPIYFGGTAKADEADMEDKGATRGRDVQDMERRLLSVAGGRGSEGIDPLQGLAR